MTKNSDWSARHAMCGREARSCTGRRDLRRRSPVGTPLRALRLLGRRTRTGRTRAGRARRLIGRAAACWRSESVRCWPGLSATSIRRAGGSWGRSARGVQREASLPGGCSWCHVPVPGPLPADPRVSAPQTHRSFLRPDRASGVRGRPCCQVHGGFLVPASSLAWVFAGSGVPGSTVGGFKSGMSGNMLSPGPDGVSDLPAAARAGTAGSTGRFTGLELGQFAAEFLDFLYFALVVVLQVVERVLEEPFLGIDVVDVQLHVRIIAASAQQ